MADIRLSVVTYVHEHLEMGNGSDTIGQSVDRMINDALQGGQLVADLTVEFTEAERHKMCSDFHAGPMASSVEVKRRK
jgi:hypothetical protein